MDTQSKQLNDYSSSYFSAVLSDAQFNSYGGDYKLLTELEREGLFKKIKMSTFLAFEIEQLLDLNYVDGDEKRLRDLVDDPEAWLKRVREDVRNMEVNVDLIHELGYRWDSEKNKWVDSHRM